MKTYLYILFSLTLLTEQLAWARNTLSEREQEKIESAKEGTDAFEAEKERKVCGSFNCDVDAKRENNKADQQIAEQAHKEWTKLLMLHQEDPSNAIGDEQINPVMKDMDLDELEDLSSYFNDLHQRDISNWFDQTIAGLDLLKNRNVIDRAKGAVAKAGAEALGHGIRAALFHKQGKQIEDAIDDVRAFDPSQIPVQEDSLQISQCQFDPSLPGCAGLLNPGQTRDFANMNVNIGGGGGNQVIGNPGQGADLGNSNNNNALATGTGNTTSPIGIGSSGALNTGKGSDFDSGVPGAARVNVGQGASGGGSGGGAPGSPGAPANTNQNKGGQTPQQTRGANTSNIAYGGGKSSLKYNYGGLTAAGRTRKSNENPFKKLFGGKDKTLSFRNPAGVSGKGSNIWKQISDRYTKISKDPQRLLQYEKVR